MLTLQLKARNFQLNPGNILGLQRHYCGGFREAFYGRFPNKQKVLMLSFFLCNTQTEGSQAGDEYAIGNKVSCMSTETQPVQSGCATMED
jgi:hypothetical protein